MDRAVGATNAVKWSASNRQFSTAGFSTLEVERVSLRAEAVCRHCERSEAIQTPLAQII